MSPRTRLILASGSSYRRALLERLRIPFECREPDVDERRLEDEEPAVMALRLALSKATVACEPGSVVIGADQVPSVEGRILRKPGDRQRAIEQLTECRGKTVLFHTAVVLLDSTTGKHDDHVDETRVQFAQHDDATLARYVDTEKPYDCAGGFKAEGLGIALFRSIASDDPTALIGLPLIAVSHMLRAAGLDPLGAHDHE